MHFLWILLAVSAAAARINVTERSIVTTTNTKIYFYDRINAFEFNATGASGAYVTIEYTNGVIETPGYSCEVDTCNYTGSYEESYVLNSLRSVNYTAGARSGVITFKLKDQSSRTQVSIGVIINNPVTSDCVELSITITSLLLIVSIGWLLANG